MSYSFAFSESNTFTVTHARYMASKIATDLKRIQRFYGAPSDDAIARYENEITDLLKANLVETVTYGFKRDGTWIEPTLRYTARELNGASSSDDDPGRILPGADVRSASFSSFLIFSTAWDQLSGPEREAISNKLPFKRVTADEPAVSGYLSRDLTYSSGGRAMERAILRSFG